MSQATSDNTKARVICAVLDVLFGSGIFLALLMTLYGLMSGQRGTALHGLAISSCFTFLTLCLAVRISASRTSTFGTPLVNMYRKLGIRLIILGGLVLGGTAILLDETNLPHLPPFALCGLSCLMALILLCNLLVIRGLSSSIRRQRKYPALSGCSILMVGDRRICHLYANSIPTDEIKGITIASIDPRKTDTVLKDAQRLIEQFCVEKAIFFRPGEASGLIRHCQAQGIEIMTPPADRSLKPILGNFDSDKQSSEVSVLQFAFNRLMALVMIIATSPVWLIAAIGIRLADKGPVFYQQARSGLYGKHFGMWKFRTMYIDAEKRLDEIKAKYGNDMSGPIFKLEKDPRIFRFGHFLRKFSIDELPQFINVLLGDMNIVGPRPLPVYETEAFEKIEHRYRLCVPPGLTCYWQIEGRSDITDFDALIELDRRYIDNRNFVLDLSLILKTIPAVLLARGAK